MKRPQIARIFVSLEQMKGVLPKELVDKLRRNEDVYWQSEHEKVPRLFQVQYDDDPTGSDKDVTVFFEHDLCMPGPYWLEGEYEVELSREVGQEISVSIEQYASRLRLRSDSIAAARFFSEAMHQLPLEAQG